MSNLNSFFQKLVEARPATDVNPEGRSGLDKDHFALIQEHLFYAELIFERPTQLLNKYMGENERSNFSIPYTAGKNIYNFYAEQSIIPLSIRSVTLPNASTNASDNEINTDFGKVVFPSKGTVIPDTNVLTIQFLNSEQNILEHMIFDWIIETKSNVWLYDTHPFSRAKIRINYLDQKAESIIFSYDFFGAFPLAYDTINSNHVAEPNVERGATFAFNWFNVNHKKRKFRESANVLGSLEDVSNIVRASDDIRNFNVSQGQDTTGTLEDLSNIVRTNESEVLTTSVPLDESLQNLAALFPNNNTTV